MNLNNKYLQQSLKTIKTELKGYIADRLQDYDTETINQLTEDNELHHELFNTDYYIIGYYKAEQWLKSHNIDITDAYRFIKNYEIDNFYGNDNILETEADIWVKYSKSGKVWTIAGFEFKPAINVEDIDQEKIVNTLVYIVGEELIYELETITQ